MRGPSTWPAEEAPTTFDARLHALVDEHVADSDDGRRTALRHRLGRQLLDDPVIYIESLDPEARAYFVNQRGPMAARLSEAAGLTAERRAEGMALVDETGDLTDIAMPAEGTDAHATLLVADYLAKGLGRDVTCHLREEHVTAFLSEAKGRYGQYWRKSAREPGAERELASIALDRLEKLRLIARDGDTIRALPALARFALGQPEMRVTAAPPRSTGNLL